jgi:hypothetical protein
MNHMIQKADQERQGWSRSSDDAWAAGYVVLTILLVLLWASVPAWGSRIHVASARAQNSMRVPAYDVRQNRQDDRMSLLHS